MTEPPHPDASPGAPPDARPDARPAPPLWQQIARSLSSEIGPAGLQPGARLPTEAQLAARFAVNRHTVRRAIEQMARGGLVRVERGRGCFVADDLIDYPVRPRTRFNEWITRQNREPSGQVLFVREQPAGPQVAAGLGIAPGDPVALMERLGFADAVPISLASHFFDLTRLPGILGALRATPTVTAALRAAGVADYVRRSTRVTARAPTPVEAALLRVPRARPLLVCENTNVDAQGRVVEFGLTRHPSARVQVVFEP